MRAFAAATLGLVRVTIGAGNLCGATSVGTLGSSLDGAGGSTQPTTRGTLLLAGTNSIWVGNPWRAGGLVTNGTGDGGGGAGGCRAPLLGCVGRAGDASIGVVISAAVLNMSNSLIVRGNGGSAGTGGSCARDGVMDAG